MISSPFQTDLPSPAWYGQSLHIETACIAVLVDILGSQLNIIVVYKTAGAHEKAIYLVGRIWFFTASKIPLITL
jgi:hypothetical protein